MLDPTDLRDCIIDPTLKAMDMYSPEASDLVLGTGLAESGLRKLRQVGGPARGLFQMEPATEQDIQEYIDRKFNEHGGYLFEPPSIKEAKRWRFLWEWTFFEYAIDGERLTLDLPYAVAMCRLHYWRVPHALPKTTFGQAEYWKIHYNTRLGKGTPEHYMAAWKHAGLPIREVVGANVEIS